MSVDILEATELCILNGLNLLCKFYLNKVIKTDMGLKCVCVLRDWVNF